MGALRGFIDVACKGDSCLGSEVSGLRCMGGWGVGLHLLSIGFFAFCRAFYICVRPCRLSWKHLCQVGSACGLRSRTVRNQALLVDISIVLEARVHWFGRLPQTHWMVSWRNSASDVLAYMIELSINCCVGDAPNLEKLAPQALWGKSGVRQHRRGIAKNTSWSKIGRSSRMGPTKVLWIVSWMATRVLPVCFASLASWPTRKQLLRLVWSGIEL